MVCVWLYGGKPHNQFWEKIKNVASGVTVFWIVCHDESKLTTMLIVPPFTSQSTINFKAVTKKKKKLQSSNLINDFCLVLQIS